MLCHTVICYVFTSTTSNINAVENVSFDKQRSIKFTILAVKSCGRLREEDYDFIKVSTHVAKKGRVGGQMTQKKGSSKSTFCRLSRYSDLEACTSVQAFSEGKARGGRKTVKNWRLGTDDLWGWTLGAQQGN